MRVLLAGDGFVTTEVMREALRAVAPDVDTAEVSSTWPYTPFHDVAEVHEALGDEDELIAALQGCDAVISHTYPFTEKVLEACPDLKMISICRGGPVNANIDAATRHEVIVTNAPGRNAGATAEHSVAMILATVRQLAQHDAAVRTGDWHAEYYSFDLVGDEISTMTVGVIGYGAVGRRVANIMAAFGGRVIVFDPWARNRDDAAANVEFVDELDELLRRSNIVTIHARVTPENHHMLNAAAIATMPRGSVIINCARGPLMNYDDVCDALDSGHLFAAGFDCLPEEPLPVNHRLLHTDHVTITPHLAGASKEAARIAARIAAADVAAFARGERPDHLMNPDLFDKE